MIVNVYREEAGKRNLNKLNLLDDNSIELKKIKELLSELSLDYVSSCLHSILGITTSNIIDYFNQKNSNILNSNDGLFRVVIYVRLSVEDGDLIDGDISGSIRNQLLYLLSEAKKRNWKVVAIFCEEGISGADDNRPEWNKSLKYIENGYAQIFLCKSQSRFSRSLEMIEKYLHKEFVSWNVRFVGLVDSTDTSIKGNKKARQINGLVNEWLVEDQSINTREILKNKKKNGLYTGSFAPYGYIKDPNDKYHLIIDEEAAKVVRKIFDMYVKGAGYHTICEYLNEERILTPTEYKKKQGLKFHCANSSYNTRISYQVEADDTLEKIAMFLNSTVDSIIQYNNLLDDKIYEGQIIVVPCRALWKRDTIRKMLMDEVYIGTLVQGKIQIKSYKEKKHIKVPEENWIKVPHCHNPIIDKETWDLVAQRFKNSGRNRSTKNGEVHIFSKKVYCSCCNKAFQKNIGNVKDGKKEYLRCRTRKNCGNSFCDNVNSIGYDDLENIVLNEINEKLSLYYNKIKVEKNYYEKNVSKRIFDDLEILKNERHNLDNLIKNKENALILLYDDRANGIIDLTEFNLIKAQYNKSINEAKIRIAKIDKEFDEIEIKKEKNLETEKILKKYKKIKKLNKIVLDEFIDKVFIGKIDPETKKRKINILWNISVE